MKTVGSESRGRGFESWFSSDGEQWTVESRHKDQALIHNSLPPTTVIIDSFIDLENLSAKGHLFVGAQMALGNTQVTFCC